MSDTAPLPQQTPVRHWHWHWAAAFGWLAVVLLLMAIWWGLGFLHFTVEFSGRFSFHEPATVASTAVTAPTATADEATASRAGIKLKDPASWSALSTGPVPFKAQKPLAPTKLPENE